MAVLGCKSLNALATVLAILFGVWFMVGAAAAQGCVDKMTPNWLPPRINIINPAPVDRQAIMDVIYSYNWALDDKNSAAFAQLFTDDAVYYACSGGGNVQIVTTTANKELDLYIADILSDLGQRQARHFESNTLLHTKDEKTVIGKTTLLVTLQGPDKEVPELDYTAVMKETFVKGDDNIWRFSKLTLITDTPGAQARAR